MVSQIAPIRHPGERRAGDIRQSLADYEIRKRCCERLEITRRDTSREQPRTRMRQKAARSYLRSGCYRGGKIMLPHSRSDLRLGVSALAMMLVTLDN